jgi:phage head maturation protease
MSFGFRTVEDRWHTEDGVETRELVKVDLIDVSPVTFPAYKQTDVEVAKRSCEEWKREMDKRSMRSTDTMRRRLQLETLD